MLDIVVLEHNALDDGLDLIQFVNLVVVLLVLEHVLDLWQSAFARIFELLHCAFLFNDIALLHIIQHFVQ